MKDSQNKLKKTYFPVNSNNHIVMKKVIFCRILYLFFNKKKDQVPFKNCTIFCWSLSESKLKTHLIIILLLLSMFDKQCFPLCDVSFLQKTIK